MDHDTTDIFADGGEMGALMRSIDWSKTPVGPVQGWSQALRTMVCLLLRNRFPILLWWGPRFVQFYNDAYRPIPGAKHPTSMGQTASECWAEIWHIIGPMVEAPFRGEAATWSDDLELYINRRGFLEESHFKVAYSPVPDETVEPTRIGGVLATVAETTQVVFGERQLRALRELGARAATAQTPDQACETSADTFRENPRDVPFALLYLLDEAGERLRLAASCGLRAGVDAAAPASQPVASPAGWPLERVVTTWQVEIIDDLAARFGSLPAGAAREPARAAIALPLASPDQARAYGVLIAGLSPHRALDETYRGFFELAAGQIVTAIRNARAYQEERKRAEALAAIDRAKTEFFSNVSHEFRTPLTLMLGPTEDALSSNGPLDGDALQIVHRNQLRLLKLVNNLLDFARLEAGRAQASYEPTDLAALTRDVASSFRAAIERAGLEYRVEGPAADAPTHVDREMWEKIVLNLLSNALKFTFAGAITVSLAPGVDRVELRVTDTGTGIPEHELPHLFERFHRVHGARARTHEGSGIGLALVHELVRLHGGELSVASELDRGTTFTISIPRGTGHLPASHLGTPRLLASTATPAAPYVAEAMRWLDDGGAAEATSVRERDDDSARARILLADDNADMRDYVRRILERRWDVEAVADGEQALAAARARPPDLILTDVMMPNLDGFGLLRRLRDDEALRATPVVMVSARAGEEATVDGLAGGADDYLVKPFSARELVSRVETQLKTRAAARAKDEFLAMLGHALRNPLAPILTALQLMHLRGSHIFEKERAVIDRQVRHVVRLVDDLLEVSRMARGKLSLDLQPVDLGEAIARAVELASPLLERGMHHLTIDVEEDLAVEGDLTRLAQVFANLLANAAKYTPAGGSIAVTAMRQDGTIRVAVKDTGMGVRPEMLPLIFDLFVQGRQALDRAQGGLGLGLSIVKSLVTLHRGRVEARSDGPGRGSEFVVTLPALAADRPAPSAGERAIAVRPELPGPRPAGRQILLVDDNEDAAGALADALEELGHSVKVAHDGPAALVLLETYFPDIAFLDIGLPAMDGYELARRIRCERRLAGIRLVSITGYGQPSDRERASAAGFDLHLVKPVDLELVEQAITGDPN